MREANRLEQVQRLGTRMVNGMTGLKYEERCQAMKTFTLQYRRRRADLIFVHKVVRQRRQPELLKYFLLHK